ncbi:MAG TPA: DUF6596 domain-containing protein [Acidimicrobiales bacterium]
MPRSPARAGGSPSDPSPPASAGDPQRVIGAVWSREAARIIARVARMVGDVGTAEELAQDALVAALERWPATGVPDNPGAWLMATAKNRAIDLLRRRDRLDRPFELPAHDELGARLASVLEVVYLIFNEGYAATAGDDWLRPELCSEALRLGRVLAALAPDEPEVQGLVALMEIQASRARARTGPAGEPVLLLDQNRGLWDRTQIRRGLAALDRAERTLLLARAAQCAGAASP